MSYCTIFKKQIRDDAYVDSTGPVSIKLLDNFRKEVGSSGKYVQLDNSKQILYVVPVSTTPSSSETRLYQYYLRITNTNGESVDDGFYAKIEGGIPTRNFGVQLKAQVLKSTNKEYVDLYNFVDQLAKYFGTSPTSKIIQVYQYEKETSSNLITVRYQNCTLRETPCDDGSNFDIKNMMSSETVVKEVFVSAMKPTFDVKSVTEELLGVCTIKNSPPYVNFGPFFDITKVPPVLPPLNFTVKSHPGFHKLVIPTNIMLSEAYNGQLTYTAVVSTNPLEISPSTHWMQAIKTSQQNNQYTLYVTLTDEAWPLKIRKNAGYNAILLHLLIADPRNAQAYLELTMTVLEQPLHYYVVEFQFSLFQKEANIDISTYYMQLFLTRLIERFGASYRDIIYLKSFVFAGGSTAGTAVWGLNVSPGCNVNVIQAVQKIMFLNITSKTINPNFKTDVSSLFTLSSIKETFTGPCTLDPPYKTRTIPPLEIPYCGLYTYVIPQDSFRDNQDGGTRNLTLKLVNNDRTGLSETWIQFDKSSQIIYGLLPNSGKTMQLTYSFKLLVTDKTNLELESPITVNIKGNTYPESYRIDLLGIYTPVINQENVGAAIVVATKVSAWLGTTTDGFELVSHERTSNGEELIGIGNCTWRYNPCDAVNLYHYRTKFFEKTGQIISAFKESLKPEFVNPTFSQVKKGPCATDEAPKLITNWEALNPNTCSTFRSQIPENTFVDKEEGNTRNLRLTFEHFVNLNLAAIPYWVRFDEKQQLLTMLPFMTLSQTTYTYTMKAFDITNQSASMSLSTNVQIDTNSPSHVISMRFKVNDPQIKNFIDLYNTLRNKVQIYFKDVSDTVEYISMSQYPNIIYDVKWTNCTLSKTSCERSKFEWIRDELLTNTQVNPSFKLNMGGEFSIESVSVTYDGICKEEEKLPVVLNNIPDQNITYCWYLRYKIPANTFSDAIDGNTRQLSLSLTFTNGSSVPISYWLGFDQNKQEVTAVLISTNPFPASSYSFKVTATTKRGLSISTILKVNIIGVPSPERMYLRLTMRVDTKFRYSFKTRSEALALILQKTSTVFNLPITEFHFYYSRYEPGKPFLSPKFISCGYKNCTEKPMEDLKAKIDTTDLTSFGPEFKVTNKIIRYGKPCLNAPPSVLQPIKPFKIQRCRAFRHDISSEIFTDDEGSLSYIVAFVNGVSETKSFQMEGTNIVGKANNYLFIIYYLFIFNYSRSKNTALN